MKLKITNIVYVPHLDALLNSKALSYALHAYKCLRWVALKVFCSSLPSIEENLYTPDPVAYTTTKDPNQFGSNFPFTSSFATILLIFFFSTKSPTLNSFGLIFLLKSLFILA